MTATDTAAAAVTGITEEQLAALQDGGWCDTHSVSTPGWRRDFVAVLSEDDAELVWQQVWLSDCGRWFASSKGETAVFHDSLEKMLAWCDDRAGDAKPTFPAKPSPPTKQEALFARMAAAARRKENRR